MSRDTLSTAYTFYKLASLSLASSPASFKALPKPVAPLGNRIGIKGINTQKASDAFGTLKAHTVGKMPLQAIKYSPQGGINQNLRGISGNGIGASLGNVQLNAMKNGTLNAEAHSGKLFGGISAKTNGGGAKVYAGYSTRF